MPGEDENSVLFSYSWMDLLRHLDETSKSELFGHQGEHKIVACLFIRLAGSYDHKRSHNARNNSATFFWADRDKDEKSGYGLVRMDGTVMFVCPPV